MAANLARGDRAGHDRQVQARRFVAQLLSGEPARSAVAVAERLVAIQAQDPRAARLAIRSRTAGLTASDVDRALTHDRSLVLTWLNRGTLHLIRSEDYWWLHLLTARPQFQVGCHRVLARLGVSAQQADKGVAACAQALADAGPMTRAQLAERLATAGLPPDAGVALHVLMLASLRGVAVRGPMIGAQHAYVAVRDWLGPRPPRSDRDAADDDVALGELARRYLAGHGPAADRDLAKWAGLPVGQARRGFRAIAAELSERPDGLTELCAGRDGVSGRRHQPGSPVEPQVQGEVPGAPTGHGDDADLPAPRLLGAFDAVLMGWASRAPIIGSHQGIVTANGLFRPFALVDGRAAAIWSYSAGDVILDRFKPLPAETEAALAAEARDVQRFLAGSPAAGADRDEAA